MNDSNPPHSASRYEIRDWTKGASRKAYHVWDHEQQRDVFHTDNRQRAETLVAQAGGQTVTQHLKDRGHFWVDSDRKGVCARCTTLK